MTQEQNELRLYSQICADAYGNGCNNSLSSDWEKLILVIDNRVSGEYYYDFKQIVCRLGLSAFSKIFDFVKNVWFPISQQKNL